MSASRAVVWLLAMGCGTSETSYDRPPVLDTGEERVDPPLDGASIAVGVFTCPERSEVPSDFLGFREGAPYDDVKGFSDAVRALAEGWLDPACLEGCTEAACNVEGCSTAAGATVDYVLATTGTGVTEEIVVVAPDGEDWTDLRVAHTLLSATLATEPDGIAQLDATFEASWTGTLDAAWPEDASVSGGYGPVDAPATDGATSASWDHGRCVWMYAQGGGDWTMSVSTPGPSGVLVQTTGAIDALGKPCGDGWLPRGWVAGVDRGVVDPNDWSLSSCRE